MCTYYTLLHRYVKLEKIQLRLYAKFRITNILVHEVFYLEHLKVTLSFIHDFKMGQANIILQYEGTTKKEHRNCKLSVPTHN